MSKSENPRPIFDKLVFVVSKTEDPQIASIICDNGGKVKKSLTNKTDYFVQGYNIDDDDRLAEASKKCIRVIAPEYIKDCAEARTLLNINLQALGKFENNGACTFPDYFKNYDILSCFCTISEHCRELEEQPQSFGEFLKTEKYVPTSERNIIYIQPFRQVAKLGKSRQKRSASAEEIPTIDNGFNLILEKLETFMSFFFSMAVKCLPEIHLEVTKKEATLKTGTYDYKIALCNSQKGWVRLDAMEIIGCLEELKPKDGFCILGVTDVDIFEDTDHEEPLLGRATGDQAGVLSTWVTQKVFQTHQPSLIKAGSSLSEPNMNPTSTTAKKRKSGKEKSRGQACNNISELTSTTELVTDDTYEVQRTFSPAHEIKPCAKLSQPELNSLRALFNTAAHETLHMFGLDHCVYYGCVMNSWSDPHLDPLTHPDKVSPLHLCPVDLRKLHCSVGFDITTRYSNLKKIFEKYGMEREATWILEILRLVDSFSDM